MEKNCDQCYSYGHYDCEYEPDKQGKCINLRTKWGETNEEKRIEK